MMTYKTSKWLWRSLFLCSLFGLLLAPTFAFAQEAETTEAPAEVTEAEAPASESEEQPTYTSYEQLEGDTANYAVFTVNNLWICISAALVFIMHLGFTTVEAGLTQKKNAVNIIFKNVWIVCMGVLLYAAWGFNAMYPSDWTIANVFAMGSWFGESLDNPAMTTPDYNAGYTWWGDFIFQAMFAATAATIVSGAVAERVKLPVFMFFATLLVGFAYPVTGSWQWGGGWLSEMGFYDFAGSSVVHAFGGFAALACAMILGPRAGKYTSTGTNPIPGHSMPLVAIGAFLLWLGWFGFNGGSVLSADPKLVSYVFCTTTFGGAAGAIAAIVVSWSVSGKPDVSMALNGILAGLVGITAGADVIGAFSSIIIGAIAGVIVVGSTLFFDKLKIDDPVGAISVHGICGIWGTVAVGIFAPAAASVGTQLTGALAIGAFGFVFSAIVFYALKVTVGVRVGLEEETIGLDISEHGMQAYDPGLVSAGGQR